jgi:hypothetical protein
MLAPTQFELIVNRKTGRATGFTFPESFLTQANAVIE